MDYDAIVIGAGMAGVTSAFELAKNGHKVLMLESQPVPGGFATTFKRKGFVFESSVHCVDALGQEQDIREFLEDNGIAKALEFIELDSFARVIYPDYDVIITPEGNDFEELLKKHFTAENRNIGRLFRKMERFDVQFNAFSHSNLPDLIKFIIAPFVYPDIVRTVNISAERFLAKFIDDKRVSSIIAEIWPFIGLPPSRVSALYFLLVLRSYYFYKTAYVKGGFSRIFDVMVDKIRGFGSSVEFNSTVNRINTNKRGSIKSVVTKDGVEYRAKAVISNANAPDTLTSFIDNQHLRHYYRQKLGMLEKSVSGLQVYLGLKVPAKELGMDNHTISVNTSYDHDDNFRHSISGDYQRCPFSLIDHAQIDPSLVPNGKGSLLIMVIDSYSNWKNMDTQSYRIKKEQVAMQLISRAEKYLPGLSANIEVMEVATPITMERFGNSPEGAIYGFAQTVKQSGINRLGQKTKIKGLFLAGAWTVPGHGLHGCFISGLNAAELTQKYLKRLK